MIEAAVVDFNMDASPPSTTNNMTSAAHADACPRACLALEAIWSSSLDSGMTEHQAASQPRERRLPERVEVTHS
jgi:hypothetical protein